MGALQNAAAAECTGPSEVRSVETDPLRELGFTCPLRTPAHDGPDIRHPARPAARPTHDTYAGGFSAACLVHPSGLRAPRSRGPPRRPPRMLREAAPLLSPAPFDARRPACAQTVICPLLRVASTIC